MATHKPAQPVSTPGLPAARRYSGPIARIDVAAHVNAYLANCTAAQRAALASAPAGRVAATAGVATYQGQYQYRQHLRSTGARANAAHWGAGGSKPGQRQAQALAAANKLAKAGKAGARAAKQQGTVRKAAPAQASQPAPAAPASNMHDRTVQGVTAQ